MESSEGSGSWNINNLFFLINFLHIRSLESFLSTRNRNSIQRDKNNYLMSLWFALSQMLIWLNERHFTTVDSTMLRNTWTSASTIESAIMSYEKKLWKKFKRTVPIHVKKGPLTLFFLPYCMKSVKDVCSAGLVKNNIEEISIKICLKLYTYNLQARVPV